MDSFPVLMHSIQICRSFMSLLVILYKHVRQPCKIPLYCIQIFHAVSVYVLERGTCPYTVSMTSYTLTVPHARPGALSQKADGKIPQSLFTYSCEARDRIDVPHAGSTAAAYGNFYGQKHFITCLSQRALFISLSFILSLP